MLIEKTAASGEARVQSPSFHFPIRVRCQQSAATLGGTPSHVGSRTARLEQRFQIRNARRLDHVQVEPGLPGLSAVLLRSVPGHGDEPSSLEAGKSPQLASDVVTIHTGQTDVHQREIGRRSCSRESDKVAPPACASDRRGLAPRERSRVASSALRRESWRGPEARFRD